MSGVVFLSVRDTREATNAPDSAPIPAPTIIIGNRRRVKKDAAAAGVAAVDHLAGLCHLVMRLHAAADAVAHW